MAKKSKNMNQMIINNYEQVVKNTVKIKMSSKMTLGMDSALKNVNTTLQVISNINKSIESFVSNLDEAVSNQSTHLRKMTDSVSKTEQGSNKSPSQKMDKAAGGKGKKMLLDAKLNMSGIKASLISLFSSFNPFGSIGALLMSEGGKAVDSLSKKLKVGFGQAVDNSTDAQNIINSIDNIRSVFSGIGESVEEAMTNMFTSIFNTDLGSGQTLIGSVAGIVDKLAKFVAEKGPEITDFINLIVSGIAGGISNLIIYLQPAFQYIGELFQSFGAWLTVLKDSVAEMMPVIKEKMAIVMEWLGPKIELISKVFKFLIDKWIEAWPLILSTLAEVWEDIEPIFVTLAGVIDDVFVVFEKVFGFIQDKWPIFEETISKVGGVIKGVFEKMAGAISDVYDFLGKIVDKVMDILGLGGNQSSSSSFDDVDSKDKSMRAIPKATGIQYIPYDNYLALLHQGERVLTANENDQLKRGGLGGKSIVVNIPKLAESINASSPVDVDNFLGLLEDRIVGVAMNMG